MYGLRGAMFGTGGFSDGYNIGSKRPRMMESNPYFAVRSSSPPIRYQQAYGGGHGSTGFQPAAFPVVRLRGLPFNCNEIDIYTFFSGLDIVDIFLVNKDGRFSGEAFVVFSAQLQVEYALQRNRENMGRRYVEVFSCKKQDYYRAIAAEMSEGGSDVDYHDSPPPKPKKKSKNKEKLEYTEILKMRGLPYSAKKSDIIKFFGRGFNLKDGKINIVCRPDGKATGEAFVEFESAEAAKEAMCKDNMLMGTRYIELFPSRPDEARRAESSSRQ